VSAGGGTRAIVAAFFANLGIAVAKFIGFVVTGSASLLAESIHSIADTGNQGLLLLGGKRSRKDADELHQFGYARERYFWAFVVALVLFSMGALFAIYEGISKIRHPHAIDSIVVALGILGVSIVLEAYSFHTAWKEAAHARGKAKLSTYIRHARAPELPVVLLEDTGALIGLSFAFVAVVIASITDNPVWDGIGTLAIGILLAIIAVILAVEMKSLLIGESATPANFAAIAGAIADSPDVEQLIHLRTQHLGPDELLVAAKVQFRSDLDLVALAAAIDAVEHRVRLVVPIARPLYIEPDIYRPGHGNDTQTSETD
jgi:cation diffusion facilitator family transporter